MQVTIGKNDEPNILGMGISPCLLLTNKGVQILGLGLQHGYWESARVQQKIVNEATGCFLEIVS
ncbi:MAG: hypothetical protein BWX80_02324 [Candidatus Hydrogenedentes bacterium ADurb.Bin101]|nr:MAG: hypothetical protein BWX80_02324 [Candidatus Hydrogenedentes bacterium ADurb.Bin101]